MPFGKYKSHRQCVRKNRGKRNPHAYCGAIESKIKKRRAAKRK